MYLVDTNSTILNVLLILQQVLICWNVGGLPMKLHLQLHYFYINFAIVNKSNTFTLVKKTMKLLYIVCDTKLLGNYLLKTHHKLAISHHISEGWKACTNINHQLYRNMTTSHLYRFMYSNKFVVRFLGLFCGVL